MEISEKESNTIRACRYCPMCRHSCPSEFINYRESDTPRGRAILLHNVYKAGRPFEASTIEAIYNCFLCGACKSWCAGYELGGYDIPELIKFSRRDIVSQGLAPQAVQDMKNALLANENTLGLSKELAYTATVTEKQAGVVYLLGEGVNFHHPEVAVAFAGILEKSGIDFTMLASEPSSGKELDLLGYRDEAKAKALQLERRIAATGCSTVVVSDPLVYDALKNDYTAWGAAPAVAVLHVSEYLLQLLAAGRLRLRSVPFRVTLADSEFLGRFNGVYDAPRELMAALAGVNFVEMQWNRELMQSAGEAALTFDGAPFSRGKELGQKISAKAEEANADVIVVLSAAGKTHIQATTSRRVLDIAELIYEQLEEPFAGH